ncbi:MAG: hypothetical protein JNL58_00170 [Planctomyces sp.]|nr:hypothetical protein [Planctomyces sp.]
MNTEPLSRREIISLAASTALIASAGGHSTAQPIGSERPVDETPSLYPFEELSTSPITTTFAYWVVVERKPLPVEAASLDPLYHWMSYHYDAEEQASELKSFNTSDQYTSDRIRIISPVTLAQRWTPYTLATRLLGTPLRKERGSGSYSKAFGIWNAKVIDRDSLTPTSEHERHFVFLLGLACSVALRENGRIIIVGCPGWSYDSWKNDFRMMNPNVGLLMHESGYLYTDRIAQ